MIRLLAGDCRDVLAALPANSIHCCVTLPPYYGLRDYGTAQWDGGDAACDHTPVAWVLHAGRQGNAYGTPLGAGRTRTGQQYRDTCGKCGAVRVDRQIGLEATPEEYLATMVGVFREARRVLRPDGTCWVNMGDSYSGGKQGRSDQESFPRPRGGHREHSGPASGKQRPVPLGCKPKDLLMMPARLAIALQQDGWWVRSDIIWHKPNPMPESCGDRPTSAHEHVFLITKAARYYYDADAVREAQTEGTLERFGNGGAPRKTDGTKLGGSARRNASWDGSTPEAILPNGRNLRNVWTIATHAYSEAHFATFPPALAERCIKAGSRLGDTVLDPFAGAGTTLLVADRLQRDAIGVELNVEYTRMAMRRCRDDAPLLATTELGPMPEHPVETEIADLFAGAAGVSHGALVEINPGLWVCPTRVAMVVARNGVPSRLGSDVPPSVRVMVDGDPSTGWEFDTWDAAVAFAAKLAVRINEAMRHYGP